MNRLLIGSGLFFLLGLQTAQAGFSVGAVYSNFAPPPGGSTLLQFGGNYPTSYNDGNFKNYAYSIPTTGMYHFTAYVTTQIVFNGAANQNMGMRLVTCPSSGCNGNLCSTGTVAAMGGYTWLGFGGTGPYPNYTLSVTTSGKFTAGTLIYACIDNWANNSGIWVECGQGSCEFDGFSVN